MARTGSSKTMADDIYQRVRSDILGGRLEVGQRLKLAAMAADYDVSLNIVREALSRLAGDKLVKTQPQLGFAVASMTAAELKDLTFVRVSIESLALKRSIELGGVEWEAALLAAHHRLANTPIQMPEVPELRNEAYAEAHAAFHAALVSACDSPLLLEMCQSLHDAAELYRRLAYLKRRVHKDPDREHKRLVDAALSRDVERATALLSKHYEETTRVCLEAGFCLPEPPPKP
ncbi:GntR family transcriptional regulator [Variovorax sp. WS11]|uniref:GntR family transcriptional regulator n=1 Tax=Variovorax sp. WS11 TaxID=1105204 RepID=UPI000D0D2AF2|nr:GntR family transcriptional regulator [Variovorax sp. WS11]NDZ17480.1 GntR family transcriptional regulator [Variovorax sp. WS11]PSL85985.1 GntR family transcriptional regulator [Variovorax sp. WS11]